MNKDQVCYGMICVVHQSKAKGIEEAAGVALALALALSLWAACDI